MTRNAQPEFRFVAIECDFSFPDEVGGDDVGGAKIRSIRQANNHGHIQIELVTVQSPPVGDHCDKNIIVR